MRQWYISLRFFILSLLWKVPLTRAYAEKRLPAHRRGYKHYWTSSEGATYRASMVTRQKDMDENPSLSEIRAALDKAGAKTVFEVGCGYGRTLEALAPFYSVSGCDIALDLLTLVPNTIQTFKVDIVNPDEAWLHEHAGVYDVVFCRAVTMYFKDAPEEMRRAMHTMETLAKKKVLVWEWPHICEAMKRVNASEKFEYRPLPIRAGE